MSPLFERGRVLDASVPCWVLRVSIRSRQGFLAHLRWSRGAEGRDLRLIGTSEGGSANDAYQISESLIGLSPVGRLRTQRLCRVYTGEQMWDRVLEAELEDELAAVRLGNSLELGPFLGYDLVKGIDEITPLV